MCKKERIQHPAGLVDATLDWWQKWKKNKCKMCKMCTNAT